MLHNITGTLEIGTQNIQGAINEKLSFKDVDSFVKQYDIFCFQETWLLSSNEMSVPGYQILRRDRGKLKNKNTGSGGVCIIYKNALKKAMKSKQIFYVDKAG